MRSLARGFLIAWLAWQPVAAQPGRPAVTTSFADADDTVYLSDDFAPARLLPLPLQPVGPAGEYLLGPGGYRATVASFCLHAGSYGPSNGDGYLYAPLRGSRADVVRVVLQQAFDHPEVAQPDVQTLLWAIEAGVRVRDLAPPARRAAGILLKESEIAAIDGSVVEQLLDVGRAVGPLPPQASKWLDLQSRLRSALTDPNMAFAEIERMAVRQGMPPRTGPVVPRGRWSGHPSGAFVRYLPDGYSRIDLEVYVPKGAAGPGRPVSFDPRGDVAVPANTNSQRLGVSGPIERVTVPAGR